MTPLCSVLTGVAKAICEKLLEIPEYKACSRLSLYLSMEDREVQTNDILQHALHAGKDVFVPYLHKTTSTTDGNRSAVMDMLMLSSPQDWSSLQRDRWGIPTLSKESIPRRENCFGGLGVSSENESEKVRTEGSGERNGLEIVVVPGVAFDSDLGRLGHGKGYYDTFFSRYDQWRREHGLPMPKLSERLMPSPSCLPC